MAPAGVETDGLYYFCTVNHQVETRVSGIKDFFEMNRRERRGTIVVLAVIALLLAATVALRCCRADAVPAAVTDIRQLEAEADSTADVSSPSPERDKPAKSPSKKKRRPSTPKKPKPAPAPRRLDPVPQI